MVRKLFVRQLVRNVLPEGYLELAAQKNTEAIRIQKTTMQVRKEAMLLNIDFQGFCQADRANGMRDIGGNI